MQSDQIVYIFASIGALCSFIGSLAMAISVKYATVAFEIHADISGVQTTRGLLLAVLFWMSVCDMTWSFFYLLEFFPSALGYSSSVLNDPLCVLIGVVSQTFTSAARGWHWIIGLMALFLLMGKSSIEIRWWLSPWKRHSIVWGFSLFFTLLPLFGGESYGMTGEDQRECWIQDEDSIFRLIYYLPLFLLLFFDFGVFAYSLYVAYDHHLSNAWDGLLKQIFLFIGAFFIIWIIPCINRIYELASDNVPYSLICAGLIMRNLSGLSNFIVWFHSHKIQRLFGMEKSDVFEEVNIIMSQTDSKTSFFGADVSQYDPDMTLSPRRRSRMFFSFRTTGQQHQPTSPQPQEDDSSNCLVPTSDSFWVLPASTSPPHYRQAGPSNEEKKLLK